MKCYCFVTLIVSSKGSSHCIPVFRNVINDDEAAGYALRLRDEMVETLKTKEYPKEFPNASVTTSRYDVSDTIIERVAAMAVQAPNP